MSGPYFESGYIDANYFEGDGVTQSANATLTSAASVTVSGSITRQGDSTLTVNATHSTEIQRNRFAEVSITDAFNATVSVSISKNLFSTLNSQFDWSVTASKIASNQSTLTYAALNTSKGMSHVREFHDMGASGVQQIDYVVNCTNQTMAMSSFQILTAPGNLPVGFVSNPSKDLSFYKPVIEHDKQIARNVCEKQMAMNGYTSGN